MIGKYIHDLMTRNL